MPRTAPMVWRLFVAAGQVAGPAAATGPKVGKASRRAARAPAVRPAPRRGVHMAQRRGAPDAVAAWAGDTVALLQTYAECLLGQEDAARRRIDAAPGGG